MWAWSLKFHLKSLTTLEMLINIKHYVCVYIYVYNIWQDKSISWARASVSEFVQTAGQGVLILPPPTSAIQKIQHDQSSLQLDRNSAEYNQLFFGSPCLLSTQPKGQKGYWWPLDEDTWFCAWRLELSQNKAMSSTLGWKTKPKV